MTFIILLYALLASSFTAGKVLLKYTTPVFLAGIRMFIAGPLLLAYQYFSPHEEFKFKRKHLHYYIQITFFGIYLTYILRFWSLKYLPSSKTCFLYNVSPFFTALYSYIFFKETITKKQCIGLVIGFLGFIPILISSSSTEINWGELLFISWPELAIIVSAASQSYSWIVIRKLVKDKSYSPMMINGITMTLGGFISLMTAWYFEGFFPVTNTQPFILWLSFVIIVSNILCYNLYGFLLKKHSASLLSCAGLLTPIFAAFYGWGFLQERITWHFYASSTMVFSGLVIFYLDELKKQYQLDQLDQL